MRQISAYLHDDTAIGTKRRLFLLFMFNLSDWICTMALLGTGLFKEANPLMRDVVSSFFLGFVIKVAMPLSLILFAVSRIKYSDRRQILISNNIALFGVAIYFLLNIYHIMCFGAIYMIYK